ncbi:MAG: hypothetical protein ACK5NT_12040 [Pyrinomonadaceae bacterium]
MFVINAKETPVNEGSLSTAPELINTAINATPACSVAFSCEAELAALQAANAAYVKACAPDYDVGCRPDLAFALIAAANAWNSSRLIITD